MTLPYTGVSDKFNVQAGTVQGKISWWLTRLIAYEFPKSANKEMSLYNTCNINSTVLCDISKQTIQ